MKDDKYRKNIEKVERIIAQLTKGNITVEEGKQVKVQAIQLLKHSREILDSGDGKIVLMTRNKG